MRQSSLKRNLFLAGLMITLFGVDKSFGENRGELVFLPRLNPKEIKTFHIYFDTKETPAPNFPVPPSLKSSQGDTSILSIENSLINIEISDHAELQSISCRANRGSAFETLFKGSMAIPLICYRIDSKKRCVLPQNVEIDLQKGPVAMVAMCGGICPAINLTWSRTYYVFSENSRFLLKDVLTPAKGKSKIGKLSYRLSHNIKLRSNALDDLFSCETQNEKKHTGLKFSSKNWPCSKWESMGTWCCQYNPETAQYVGLAFKLGTVNQIWHICDQKKNEVLFRFYQNASGDKPTKYAWWVRAGLGDYLKTMPTLARRVEEPVPYKLEKTEKRSTSSPEHWWNDGRDGPPAWRYRKKLILNNYTDMDRSREPFLIPLEKLSMDPKQINIHSIRVVESTSSSKNDKAAKEVEIPSQIISSR